MKGSTLIAILMVAAVAGGALTIAAVYLNGSSTKTASLTGVLDIYGSGTYSTPRAFSASYNISLVSKDGVGTMNLVKIGGTGDPVAQHSYSLTDVLVDPYNVTMTIAGTNVSLGWINNSTVWKSLNESYIAASGPNAPADETIGQFSTTVFQLSTSYYVVVSLTITSQPPDTIPFAIAPLVPARVATSP